MSTTYQEIPNATPGQIQNVQQLPNATPQQYTTAQIQQMARQAAVQEGLNPSIFLALINQESSFNPTVESSAGAVGLGQLMPATAASLGVLNPKDPIQNLRGSARYLKQQLDAFGGNYNLALAAYNAGPAAVRKFGGIPPYTETQNYVKDILSGQSNYPTAGQIGGVSSTAPYTPQSLPNVGNAPGYNVKPTTFSVPYTKFTPGKEQSIVMPRLPFQFGGATVNKATDIASILQRQGTPILPGVLQALKAVDAITSQPLKLAGLPTASTTMHKITVPYGNVTPLTGKMSGSQLSSSALGVSFTGGAKPSDAATNAVSLAHEYLGTPYVWGGESPKGFDCSGLLQYIYAKQGVPIPRTTYDQFNAGKVIHPNDLQAGDAVFYKGSDSITRNGQLLPGHVAIYIGNGDVIQAPHTGANVEITPLKSMGPMMGIRRYA